MSYNGNNNNIASYVGRYVDDNKVEIVISENKSKNFLLNQLSVRLTKEDAIKFALDIIRQAQ